MHQEVINWVEDSIQWWGKSPDRVLEFGSYDINGSVRSLLEKPNIQYVGIDIVYGKGVDIVADASVFSDLEKYDIVVCCEVFEHTPKWTQIIKNAYKNLSDGGLFIATMAGEGRFPHSAIDQNPIRDFEYYHNITKDELANELLMFSSFEVNVINADTRGRGIK